MLPGAKWRVRAFPDLVVVGDFRRDTVLDHRLDRLASGLARVSKIIGQSPLVDATSKAGPADIGRLPLAVGGQMPEMLAELLG